jgi:hypothetical protein
MGNRVTLVDSGASVVRRVLDGAGPATKAEKRYFLTDLSTRSEEIAHTWLGHPVRFERADLS